MGSTRNVDMSNTTDTVKKVEVEETVTEVAEDGEVTVEPKKSGKARSKKYMAQRAKIDRTRTYAPEEAIKIIKDLSYSKFTGTISADAVVKEEGVVGSIVFPHDTGKTRKIVIMSDEVLTQIEDGKIDFDILLATPEWMPKLAKHAPVLGPQGLMPNPKQGTLTPNPEEKKKELEQGKIQLKTQRKMPVLHVTIGTVDMATDKLTKNLIALIKELGKKVVKVSISATMSPGVRINLDAVDTPEEK